MTHPLRGVLNRDAESAERRESWISGNIFIRARFLLKDGDKVQSHEHNFDHTMILFTGAARVRRGEEEIELKAPAHCLIRKGTRHEITALAPGTTWWCVYSLRTPDGEVVDHDTGWNDAFV